jgi:diguanylate cyclase (GGDEF)-like protein
VEGFDRGVAAGRARDEGSMRDDANVHGRDTTGAEAPIRRADTPAQERGAHRRASRSLWTACEALLAAAEPRALSRALDALGAAFGCSAVALHALGPSGALEPWCARGDWRSALGELRDCLSIPLWLGEERVGTLDLQAGAGQSWSPGQLALIRTASGALGAALGARIELQRLRHQPGRDPLTGLPDARAFHARLEDELVRARRHGLPLGIAIVNLDHFGALNARFGRPAGDAALEECALVLRLALRESDVLARLGSDQFAVLLPEADLLPTRRCGERLRHAIEEHRFARVGRISTSVGVSASPRNGLQSVELMESADRALAVAKKSGRRRVAALDPTAAH